MTLPEPERPRKPRRRGLFLPWLLALLLVVGLSGGWFWLRGEAVRRMDASVAQLREQGYDVAWRKRTITGFPFRLNVTLEGARIAEPSGWAIATPLLKSEAYVYRLDHWVMVAPDGVTLTRPDGGPVTVRARALRASLSRFDEHPPRLSVEGVDLAFETAPGGKPYPVESAARLQLHLRAGPQDQGGVLFKVDGARLRLEGLPARIVQGKPASMMWDLTLSKMSTFRGRDWPGAVRNWRDAVGFITVRAAEVRGGDAVLSGKGGPLTVGPGGRLQGGLEATLSGADDGTPAFSGEVDLANGEARIGPLPLGPSPRLY
jgi:hypothetical protein